MLMLIYNIYHFSISMFSFMYYIFICYCSVYFMSEMLSLSIRHLFKMLLNQYFGKSMFFFRGGVYQLTTSDFARVV